MSQNENSENEEKPKGATKKIRGFAKKILGDDVASDSKEVISTLFEMGDKARMETVRLVAKEVRGYMEAMRVPEMMHEMLTNYSLEITASFRLKPLKKEKDPKSSED